MQGRKRHEEVIDRLIEIERKQDLMNKTFQETLRTQAKTHFELLKFLEEQKERHSKEESDKEFDKSMQNEDGLYSRKAIEDRKKKKEEGE
jgi:hypothetical protein